MKEKKSLLIVDRKEGCFMSSIAYITNREMVEYHRLHGSDEIVFWRFSGKRKFHNFHHGDYIFFLTKGTEKGKDKEKGIVGYARYDNDTGGSVKSIWKQYGTKCGYGSEIQFIQAIQKYQKLHTLPKRIDCLLLNHVIFFQAPVYLSELNKRISKQVESYIYLDHEDMELSWKIMSKGADVGIDMWSAYVEKKEAVIQNDADIIAVQQLHEFYTDDLFTAYEKKKTAAFAKRLLRKRHNDSGFLAGAQNDFWKLDNKQIHFYIPCVLTIKAWKRSLLFASAKANIYQKALIDKKSQAQVTIIFDENHEAAAKLCDLLHIPYKVVKEESHQI